MSQLVAWTNEQVISDWLDPGVIPNQINYKSATTAPDTSHSPSGDCVKEQFNGRRSSLLVEPLDLKFEFDKYGHRAILQSKNLLIRHSISAVERHFCGNERREARMKMWSLILDTQISCPVRSNRIVAGRQTLSIYEKERPVLLFRILMHLFCRFFMCARGESSTK